MDDVNSSVVGDGGSVAVAEPDAERIAREWALIEQARAEVRAGYFIADQDVDEWLRRLERGEAVDVPGPPRTGAE